MGPITRKAEITITINGMTIGTYKNEIGKSNWKIFIEHNGTFMGLYSFFLVNRITINATMEAQ